VPQEGLRVFSYSAVNAVVAAAAAIVAERFKMPFEPADDRSRTRVDVLPARFARAALR